MEVGLGSKAIGFAVVILADVLLLSLQGLRFTVIFDGKVLLNETLSGKTGTLLSSEGGIRGKGNGEIL